MALPLKWTFSVLVYYEYFDPYFTHINFLQQKNGAVYIRVNTTRILYQLRPLTKKTLSSCRCPGTMLASSVWTSGIKPSTKSSWTSPVTKSDQCVPLLSFSVFFFIKAHFENSWLIAIVGNHLAIFLFWVFEKLYFCYHKTLTLLFLLMEGYFYDMNNKVWAHI